MSKVAANSDELAKVLDRINLLMGQDQEEEAQEEQAKDEELIQEDDIQPHLVENPIPQLTETYEGRALTFSARSADDFLPAPASSSAELSTAPEQWQDQEPNDKQYSDDEQILQDTASHRARAQVVEALLTEMMPIIQIIIKKAVLKELVSAEQTLGKSLEREILQSLRENLQSRLS